MTNHSATHAIFTIERSYDAPPTQVFRAFADKEIKRRWFVEGEGWTVDRFETDFRPGGREESAFRFKDGPPITNETVFHDIAQDRRIVFGYAMTVGGKRISASLATVELQPEGSGTRLAYTEQAAFLDGQDTSAQREQGWRGLLDALGEALKRQAA